jgi:hypothetical protein
MNEQRRGSFQKRKVWIAVAVALAAVAVVGVTGIDYSNTGKDAAGTIVPAQYRAPQMTGDDAGCGASGSQSAVAAPNDAIK